MSFRINYCVPPGYQFLMAEVYLHDRHVAELNTEVGYLQVVIYPPPGEEAARLPFDDLLPALQAAGSELRQRSRFFA